MINEKFDATLQLIQDKKRKISFYEKELKALFETELKEDFARFAEQLQAYHKNYHSYLELLSKYEKVEKITPLDIFPGIRTVKSMTNTAEMEEDSKTMEKLANDVKQLEATLERREGDLISNTKQVSQMISSLLSLHGEVQEAYRQIMEQLDSVYDIGFLSRNSN